MTKDEYEDFALRYKGCGACFPMYHTLSRFEKMWFSAIQKDVAELEKEKCELLGIIQGKDKVIQELKKELNKVNEWHKVSDGGDLPKNNTAVLVILKNKRMKISIFMENKFTIWNNDYDAYTKLYDVIAWCEIPTFKE